MSNTTVKVTKTDRFNAIVDFLNANGADAELIAFCEGELALLAKRSAKAKETAAAKKEAVDELTERIRDVLASVDANDKYITIADIVTALNDESVTPNKVIYRLTQLTDTGDVVSTDVKITDAADGKTKTRKGYRLTANDM